MTLPVTYVEIHTPALEETQRFLSAAFGWQPQPFVTSDYLVAAHGDGVGVDTGLTASRDGQPRCVPVINVASLEDAVDAVRANGGNQVVEPYDVPEVGRACYIIDPTGVLIGLHQNDPTPDETLTPNSRSPTAPPSCFSVGGFRLGGTP